LYADDDES